MDVLSQVLRSLRLRGSFYVAWNLNAPWGLSFESDHSAPFHYVESGEMWVVTNDGRSVHLEEGDFIVLFDGAAHRICDRPATVPERIKTVVARQPRAGIDSHIHTYGGGGRASRLVCGKFTIDERDSASASLQFPAMVHIRRDESARILAFARTLELLAEEARSTEPGAERSTALLTEVLFIQVLRIVLAQGDPMAAGWIEGLRDSNIAAALAAIHADPQKVWTLATLTRIAGLSRSVFAERFHTRVGTPPMTYLASWRLQLAARWLRETSLPVSEILHRLAYGSAGAFHRAFKREHGLAPTAYRQKHRGDDIADAPRLTRLHRSEDQPHAARHARRAKKTSR
jgi:AraC-like DNA-binding protein